MGPNLLGRLLMDLRDHGSLEYHLPPDGLHFVKCLKQFPVLTEKVVSTGI